MKNKEKYDFNTLSVDIQNACVELIDNTNNQVVFKVKSYNYVQIIIELLKWLEQEYVEPIKLTDDEVVILRNIPEEYKWLIRIRHCGLIVCNTKPERKKETWEIVPSMNLYLFNYLFQFVNWDDEEPYSIDELLKMNEGEKDENKTRNN